MKFMVSVLGVVGACLLSACGPDCREDCAIKCANFPTHACIDACENENCADLDPVSE